MKISTMIIAMILVALFSSVLVSFYSSQADTYGVTVNDSEYDVFNQLDDINNQTLELTNKTRKLTSSDSTFSDKVAAFIGSGFSALKITWQSFDTLNTLANGVMEKMPLGTGGIFIPVFIAIITVIFVFILISILVNRSV